MKKEEAGSILELRNLRLARSAKSKAVWDADVVVGVGIHNQAHSLRRCLLSILEQRMESRRLAVVILDDGSTDEWGDAVGDLLSRPEVVVLQANCGTAARTRNAILDFVDGAFANARWVARLDGDDRFSGPNSLEAACAAGDRVGARFVLGGNRLVREGCLTEHWNPALANLLEAPNVLRILEEMAAGTADNELPSCNLVLAPRTTWRYPDLDSAEDHWLVADLLINHACEGTLLETPFFCDYSLDGSVSSGNKAGLRYRATRRCLYEAASNWHCAKKSAVPVLGFGREGIVFLSGGVVEKHFYPGSIADEKVRWLREVLVATAPYIPEAEWLQEGGGWTCRYPYENTQEAHSISLDQALQFLAFCLERDLVCKNITRRNFRIGPDGHLTMVDIGNDIVPMNASYFRDAAARLYAIARLGWPDGELLRRPTRRRQEDVLADIPGFESFYAGLMTTHAGRLWSAARPFAEPWPLPKASEVTLLIKACAMDAESLDDQVRHIVSQLSTPRKFRETLLLIDPLPGPFLRQHCVGDLPALMDRANRLVGLGYLDGILVAPDDVQSVASVNQSWFGLDCGKSHSTKGVPVAPQLWAFDQISTRYVLQCDVDVLIGRTNRTHDFLADMLQAAADVDVLGVAFNIPHESRAPVPYYAAAGDYVPEVRCGLLDLERIKACRPLPNSMLNGSLALSWYRSLQEHQRRYRLRTLRGGDPQSFYVHPENHWKADSRLLAVVRDLIGQGRVPECQREQWNLKGDAGDWQYPRRGEDLVFLLKGRNTPENRLFRCFASLLMQDDQDFGLVVIDDASDVTDPNALPCLLGSLMPRTTLIRRNWPHGRIPNFITAIREICVDPETLIVILDLDDALMHRGTVSLLRESWTQGKDVIIGGMFRPDKPLKLYEPDFKAPRDSWGGNVWVHLRSFRKKLFDAIPESNLEIDGRWIEECTDYATMIPIVENSRNPTFIPHYLYFHQRTTPRTQEARTRKDEIIRRILENASLAELVTS